MRAAMILCAGRGTRLGELGRERAKVLVDVGGRPLLELHLRRLEALGVQRAVVNVSHLSGQVTDFAEGYTGGLEILCIEEQVLLGTAGGVRNALDYLLPGPFLVMYGDVLVTTPLAPMISHHAHHGGLATLAVHAADDAVGKGTVELNADGRVIGFVEKEAADNTAPVLINSGIYVLEPAFVEPIVPGAFNDFGIDVFPAALAGDRAMFGYRLPQPVIDIGTPDGLALARQVADAGQVGGESP